jgi:transcriptional regulator with XRE-family HTH domain
MVLYAVYADDMNELGERVRELRDRHDISLREFARKLGDISPAHISDIENGRRNPSEDLLQKMAQVLGVAFDELQRLDNRIPVEELRRAMRQDPALGFALRKAVEMNVSSEQILKWAEGKDAGKKGEDK